MSYPLVGALVSPDPRPASAQRRRTHCGPTESTKRLLGHNKALQETCSLLQALSHTDTQTQTPHTATCWLKKKKNTTTTQIWVVKSHKNLWVLPQLPVSASSPPFCAAKPKVFSSCANTVRPPSSVHTVHHMETRESNQKRDLRCFPVFAPLFTCVFSPVLPWCNKSFTRQGLVVWKARDLGYAPALGQMHWPRSGSGPGPLHSSCPPLLRRGWV